MSGEEGRVLKVAVACGGTGGHMIPGLATARELARRGHEVTLWLTGRAEEGKALKGAGWTGGVETVASKGFGSLNPWRVLKTLLAQRAARREAVRRMRRAKPDVLLAMGSYASAGPVAAALRLGVPVVLHESNVIPGRMICWNARRAALVATGFEETRGHLRGARRVECVGMPLRPELTTAAARAGAEAAQEAASSSDGSLRVLVTGGSQGAHRVNEVACEALCRMGGAVRVRHLTGSADEESVRARYAAAGVAAEVLAYAERMWEMYEGTDLVICRAGSSTCAELALFGKAALLVPLPTAAKDHQSANARALEKKGAADVVAESALTAEWLEAYLRERAAHRRRLADMGAAMRREGVKDGTAALADWVERAGRGEL